jgi:hypothetical protein
MIALFKNWPITLLVFYWCLMSPMVFACEAVLDLDVAQGFVERGTLGSKDTYLQKVYSGKKMSYSATVFPSHVTFNKHKALQDTAKSMANTVLSSTKNFKPDVKVLNKNLLPKIDARLAFLSYIKYGESGSVNVEASSVVKHKKCWAILRFTALSKGTMDAALNQFANLIRATRVN